MCSVLCTHTIKGRLKNLQVLPNCIIQSTKISDIFQRLDTEVDAEKEQVYISGKF